MIVAVGNERLGRSSARSSASRDADGRPAVRDQRAAHRPSRELVPLLEEILTTRDAAEWVEEFVDAGIPAGPINFPDETLTDEHVLARRMIVELEHPLIGIVKSIAVPIRFEENGRPTGGTRRASASTTRRSAALADHVVTRYRSQTLWRYARKLVAELRMAQTVLDRRAQVADLAAAVVADARERQHVHRLVGEQARDAVRELDLAAGAALRALELREDRRRQDVAADDREVRRRVLPASASRRCASTRCAPRLLGLHGDDAVAAGLLVRHGLDAEHARAVLLEVLGSSA